MRAFDGIRILDCTHVIAAPFASYQLAVLGADVIKVEDPNAPDQGRESGSDNTLNKALMGTGFLTQGSNKRAIALNLKSEAGREVLKRLVADWADVLVENYRPGAFDALGLGYDDLSKLNPKLIYASMSAFGRDGPRRSQTAYDPAIQATSGITASTGTNSSGPIKPGAPIIDFATGMVGAYAISAALYQRMRTGEGQHIDTSMLDVALILQGTLITDFCHSGSHPKRGSSRRFASNGIYQTKDGLVQLSANNARQQRRFYEVIGRPDVAASSFDERLANFSSERAIIAEKMMEKTVDEWEAYLQSERVPAARVRELREALADPQVATRGVLHRHENVPGIGKPLTVPLAAFKFAHDGPSIERSPARFAEHTDQVLRSAGYSDKQIVEMRKSGAIA